MEINKDTLSIEGLKAGDKIQRFLIAKDGSLYYSHQYTAMDYVYISNTTRWRYGTMNSRTKKMQVAGTCSMEGTSCLAMHTEVSAYYSNDPKHLKEGERLDKLAKEKAEKAKALKDKHDKSNLKKMNDEIQGVLAKYGGCIGAEQLSGDDHGVEIAVVYSVGDQEITKSGY